MGNSTIDVGGRTKPKPDGSEGGAMAQQHGSGSHQENESVPQKLVHLVGCRDPDARKKAGMPPRPAPKKT